MPLRKERKLQLREALIIESAARLVERVGYAQLTMDMLSEEVGIAKATLYQHFKSKEEVMIASTLRGLENLEQFIATHPGRAISTLQEMMRYMMLSHDDAEGFSSVIMHDEMLHLFKRHAEIGTKFQTVNARLFALVEQAKAEGDIAPELPNEVIITMMMNCLAVGSGQQLYATQDRTTMADHTLRIFFKGLRP